nr:phage baseplate assembly protein V [Cupriavidus oxalaticus]
MTSMQGTANRVGGMIGRCVVALVDSARKLQALQLRLTAGETKDGVEHFEPYGYTSCPLPGAEGIVAFPGGDRSHAVALVIGDRRFRLSGLKPGEVALYTDEGDSLVFKRGRIAELNTGTFVVNAEEKVQFNTPLVEASDEVLAKGKMTGQGGLAISGGSGASVAGDINATGEINSGETSLDHHQHDETGSRTSEPV